MTTNYDQLHPFRKYLRLLKQLPEFDYMQAKRIAETGAPRATVEEIFSKSSGVYVILNADQQQIDSLTKQIIQCRSSHFACRMTEYNQEHWHFFRKTAPLITHVFLSDQYGLHSSRAQNTLRYAFCNFRHIKWIWFYNPAQHSLRPDMAEYDCLRLIPPALRPLIDTVLDCRFGDLIRVTAIRRSPRVNVLAKQL